MAAIPALPRDRDQGACFRIGPARDSRGAGNRPGPARGHTGTLMAGTAGRQDVGSGDMRVRQGPRRIGGRPLRADRGRAQDPCAPCTSAGCSRRCGRSCGARRSGWPAPRNGAARTSTCLLTSRPTGPRTTPSSASRWTPRRFTGEMREELSAELSALNDALGRKGLACQSCSQPRGPACSAAR